GVAYLAFYVVALPVTGVIGSVLYFELGGLDGHSVPQSTPAPAVPVAPPAPPTPPAPPVV
ncbi:MAG: hypothetical protein NTY57_05685, partial [Solirubrobacterales bacterium]|nr:hypothetical protein [Solirubrobacterales bacterium]